MGACGYALLIGILFKAAPRSVIVSLPGKSTSIRFSNKMQALWPHLT